MAQQYRQFDRAYHDSRMLHPTLADMIRRSSLTGRQRAFAKLARSFGPGAVLEGLRLEDDPLAVWSIIKPREAVIVDAPPNSAKMQDCVTVNYILSGRLPEDNPRDGTKEGLWTLEIPDHALGRCMERSRLMPTAIIREAHRNILRLRSEVVVPNNMLDFDRQFLVQAGPGGFVCNLQSGLDQFDDTINLYVRCSTWLAEEMLCDNQILLVDDGAPGFRLGDSWLLPAPLKCLIDDGSGLNMRPLGELPEPPKSGTR
jgi:hypothetical protein